MILEKIKNKNIIWFNPAFIFSSILGLVFLAASFFINYEAVKFAALEAGNSVTDILLGNLPIINTDIIFSEGALLFIIFLFLLLLYKPKTIPFTLKSIALFIFIRSIFVVMTHLGPYPGVIKADFNQYKYLSSGADLFFSGHTGLPFLMSLIFWENKWLRFLFIFCSVAAAITVILGHLHYTIDVFSAYFITYGISRIAELLFSKDKQIFTNGTQLK